MEQNVSKEEASKFSKLLPLTSYVFNKLTILLFHRLTLKLQILNVLCTQTPNNKVRLPSPSSVKLKLSLDDDTS